MSAVLDANLDKDREKLRALGNFDSAPEAMIVDLATASITAGPHDEPCRTGHHSGSREHILDATGSVTGGRNSMKAATPVLSATGQAKTRYKLYAFLCRAGAKQQKTHELPQNSRTHDATNTIRAYHGPGSSEGIA